MAPPVSEFSRLLKELEAEIKRLEVEYQNYFTGRTPKLPWEMRSRVEGLIKQYDRMPIQNTAERFRFQGLQMKFSTFCELWERHLKQRELGRPGPQRSRAAESRPATPPRGGEPSGAAGAPAAARPGMVALRNPEAEPEKLHALHEQLNDARRRVGEAEVPFERFQDVVRAQVAKLGREGGEVAFRVGEKDGRVTFTAKVAKDSEEE